MINNKYSESDELLTRINKNTFLMNKTIRCIQNNLIKDYDSSFTNFPKFFLNNPKYKLIKKDSIIKNNYRKKIENVLNKPKKLTRHNSIINMPNESNIKLKYKSYDNNYNNNNSLVIFPESSKAKVISNEMIYKDFDKVKKYLDNNEYFKNQDYNKTNNNESKNNLFKNINSKCNVKLDDSLNKTNSLINKKKFNKFILNKDENSNKCLIKAKTNYNNLHYKKIIKSNLENDNNNNNNIYKFSKYNKSSKELYKIHDNKTKSLMKKNSSTILINSDYKKTQKILIKYNNENSNNSQKNNSIDDTSNNINKKVMPYNKLEEVKLINYRFNNNDEKLKYLDFYNESNRNKFIKNNKTKFIINNNSNNSLITRNSLNKTTYFTKNNNSNKTNYERTTKNIFKLKRSNSIVYNNKIYNSNSIKFDNQNKYCNEIIKKEIPERVLKLNKDLLNNKFHYLKNNSNNKTFDINNKKLLSILIDNKFKGPYYSYCNSCLFKNINYFSNLNINEVQANYNAINNKN